MTQATDYRLIALDLDGTILNERQQMSPATRAAVAACRARGIDVVLASGRSYASMIPYAHELELDEWLIALNGGTLGHSRRGQLRARRHMTAEQIRHVAQRLVDEQVRFVLFGLHGLYALEGSADAQALTAYGEPPVEFVTDLTQVAEPLKILAFERPGRREQRLKPLMEPLVDQVRTGELFLEWVPPGISKGDALRGLMAERGLAAEQVLAIGDGYNDISLFDVAGMGIAMGNAPAAVKRAARAITARCDDDGVAQALQAHVL